MKEHASVLCDWKQVATYCVGPATDSLARSQLDLQHCIGSDSGNAKQLAKQIVLDVRRDSKPLLYPCSEIARETIASVLNDNGISVKKLVVYRTLESELLEQDLMEVMKKFPSIFVFFSPSTVEFVAARLEKNSYNTKDIKAVAIGPVTREALIKFGFKIYATADKPEPAALMRAIATAENAQ